MVANFRVKTNRPAEMKIVAEEKKPPRRPPNENQPPVKEPPKKKPPVDEPSKKKPSIKEPPPANPKKRKATATEISAIRRSP
jgi:hypothetical protein